MISWMGVSRSGGGGRGPTTQGTYPTAVSINYYARVSTLAVCSVTTNLLLYRKCMKYQMIVLVFCFYIFTYTNCIKANAIFTFYLYLPPPPPPPQKKKKSCMV